MGTGGIICYSDIFSATMSNIEQERSGLRQNRRSRAVCRRTRVSGTLFLRSWTICGRFNSGVNAEVNMPYVPPPSTEICSLYTPYNLFTFDRLSLTRIQHNPIRFRSCFHCFLKIQGFPVAPSITLQQGITAEATEGITQHGAPGQTPDSQAGQVGPEIPALGFGLMGLSGTYGVAE